MKQFLKRLISLILCLAMVLDIAPVALAENYESGPFTLMASEAATPTASEEFESAVNSYISIVSDVATDNVGDKHGAQLVGKPFTYTGKLHLVAPNEYKHPDSKQTEMLFECYEDVVVKVKAPAGITLLKPSGEPFAASDYDENGFLTVISEDEIGYTVGETTEVSFSVSAVMDGNGSTLPGDYSGLEYYVDAKVMVVKTNENDDDEQKSEHHIKTQNVAVSGSTATHGIAEAEWTSLKAAEAKPVVSADGQSANFTYYIEVGRTGDNGHPSSYATDYDRFGTLDVLAATITDSVSPVTDKSGNVVYPTDVIVKKGSVDVPVTLIYTDGEISGFTIDEAALNTVSGSTKGCNGFKSYTKFTVTTVYPTANFTYPIVETKQDDFVFENAAILNYTTSEGNFTSDETSDKVAAHWVAEGGNVSITEHIFLSASETDPSASELFSEYYQAIFNGMVSYTIYQADEDGKPITDGWSRTIALNSGADVGALGSNGTVVTTDSLIPEGPIAIVPNVTGVDSDFIKQVNEYNGDSYPAYLSGVVQAAGTTYFDFYLGYINGGFASVTKKYYEISNSGALVEVSTSSKKSTLASNTTFTLKPVTDSGEADPSRSDVTLKVGSNLQGVASLRPGKYKVVENAPSGYAPVDPFTITVTPGQTTDLNGGKAVNNYPATGTIKVRSKTSDFFKDEDLTKTKTKAATVKNKAITFHVEQKVGDSWTTVEGTTFDTSSDRDITLPTIDSNGNVIEYRVVYTGTDAVPNYTYAGSVLNASKDEMTYAKESESFTFDYAAGDKPVQSCDLYFRNYFTVKVQKTLNDSREVPATLAGWSMALNGETSATTDANGVVEFANLPVSEVGSDTYLSYTVAEAGVDATVWDIAYSPDPATVTAEGRASSNVVTVNVTNTILQGSITLVKTDADNTATKLPDAEYHVYYIDDQQVKHYLTDSFDENGARLFTTTEAEASAFKTGTTGSFTLKGVVSGFAYYAQEITAPDHYFINPDPISLGTLDKNGTLSTSPTDTHHPKINVKKIVVDTTGNVVTAENGSYVDFQVFDEDFNVIKDGETAVTLRATKNSSGFVTTDLELPDYGTYYLKENGASEGLLLPEARKVAGQSYVEHEGSIYFGPYTVPESTNKKQVSVTFEAKDMTDFAPINITKKNKSTGSVLSGATMGVVVAVKAKADDMSLFSGTWSKTCPAADVADQFPALSDGYEWYFSTQKTLSSVSVPLYDKNGNEFNYKLIEMTPPDGFDNLINPDGTQGHNVSEAVLNSDATAYSVTFEDYPSIRLEMDKFLAQVWNIVTSDDDIVAYYMPGVEMALYHVTADGTLDALLDSGRTSGEFATLDFDDIALDPTQRYAVVETDSLGYDTSYDGTTAPYSFNPISVSPSSLVGKNLTDLKTNVYLSDEWTWPTYSDTIFGHIGNYEPYFKFIVTKRGIDTNGEVITVMNEHLDECKFKMYTVPLSVYDNGGFTEATKANYTDDYIYESGMYNPGQFMTDVLDYMDGYVYIFEEIETVTGYEIINKYTVITPDQYADYKNQVCPVTIDNEWIGGEGDGSDRAFRVLLDKYLDKNDSGKYEEEEDKKLSLVTFTLTLVDEDGKTVESKLFNTFFKTGLDNTNVARGVSETIRFSRGELIADLKDEDLDKIFTFWVGSEKKTAADYKAATVAEAALYELEFDMRLTESEFPEEVTPYQVNYTIRIKTSAAGTVENKKYIVPNPILNVSGKYVMVQGQKLVNGAKWKPAFDGDYVEFTFTPLKGDSGTTIDTDLEVQISRIDSSNYKDPQIVQLEPMTRYEMVETHAPKGMDKPYTNRVTFKTLDLLSRISDKEDERIQKVQMTDTPYIPITVIKKDSEGNPVQGVKLKAIYYADRNKALSSMTAIKDANKVALPDSETILTTDADGKVVFYLPYRDYHVAATKSGATGEQYKTYAVYYILELDANGNRVKGFDAINVTTKSGNTNRYFKCTESVNSFAERTLINQEPSDLIIKKVGLAEGDEPLDLKDVSFDVYYAPFTVYTEYTTLPTALPATMTKLGTYSTDENGIIKLEKQYSGYYKLVEKSVPAGYMHEGAAYTSAFVFVTPQDAKSIAQINTSTYYWTNKPITMLTVSAPLNPAITTETKIYNTAEPATVNDLPAVKVTNVHKAALVIDKQFIDSALLTAPATMKYWVLNNKNVKVAETTVSISDGKGTSDLIRLEPGTYTVVEVTAAADSFFGTVNVTGSKDASSNRGETLLTPVFADSVVQHKVADIIVNEKNIDTDPVKVSFTNRSAKMELKAKKVNDAVPVEPVKGAEFVIYCTVNGTKYYYVGEETNGMGKYSTKEGDALHFISDVDGLLDAKFTAYFELLKDDEIGTFVNDYTLQEVKADLAFREFIEDLTLTFAVGEVKDLTGEAKEYLVDTLGLAVDFTLFGRTYANTQSDSVKPPVPGVVFELYKVKNGKGTLVTTFDDLGHSQTKSTTNDNGEGYFHNLDLLEQGETYVLVEKASGEGYHDLDYYMEAHIGSKLSETSIKDASGNDLVGYTVYTYPQDGDWSTVPHQVSVDVYNMPKSKLLVLKYDYDYPTSAFPILATFSVNRTGNTDAEYKQAEYSTTAQVKISDAADASVVKAASEKYGYHSGSKYYFTDSAAQYSFFNLIDLYPGQYTIVETEGPRDEKGNAVYFYTPAATPDDPWYTTRTVDVDDDGGIAYAVFANVPDPRFNDVGLNKDVEDVNGLGADADLGNLQELLNEETGEMQHITFSISNFAPCLEKGKVVEYVKYPSNVLYVQDHGLTFKTSEGTEDRVDYKIDSITIGTANYVDGAVSTLEVDVYAATAAPGSAWTKLGRYNVATETVTIEPDADYQRFKVVYCEEGLNDGKLKAKFKANDIIVTYSMQERDDPEAVLVSKVINDASVTMGYDIGITDASQKTFTAESDAGVNADDKLVLPTASIVKDVSIYEKVGNKNEWVKKDRNISVPLKPEDQVRYEIVFTNSDLKNSGLGIEDSFIIDLMPDCIDVTSVSGATTDSGVTVHDPIIDNGKIYVKTSGELMPGKTLTLTIEGTANTAKLLSSVEIKNNAYAGSETVTYKNTLNPQGSPFLTEQGGSPSNSEALGGTEFAEYGVLPATRNHLLDSGANLSIYKLVAADKSGKDNWKSGSKDPAIAYADGNVYYRILVGSDVSQGAGELRIADVLPFVGDTHIGGGSRNSEFAVVDPVSVSVTRGGKSLSHSLIYTTSTSGSVYQTALKAADWSSLSGWSTDSTGAKGFAVKINEELTFDSKNTDYVVISFTCKAPSAFEKNGNKVKINYFNLGVNTATAWTAKSPDTMPQSNPVVVTILPPDQEVAVGDRIWLDKNANGLQDEGEDDFTDVAEIYLRTFDVGNNKKYKTGAPKSLGTGWYKFSGLMAALLADGYASGGYDKDGNADITNLDGTLRYMYQMAIQASDIPEGYIVTKAYAGNGGKATTYGVTTIEDGTYAGLKIFDGSYANGAAIDSDFVLDGENYVTRRVYLPIRMELNKTTGEYEFVKNPEYLSFDMGLIRTRDLFLEKLGTDLKPVKGAKFAIYGPYEEKPSAAGWTPATGESPVATLTTDKDGKASFVSTDSTHFLNYYGYYVLSEVYAPKPYDGGIVEGTGNVEVSTDVPATYAILLPGNNDVRIENVQLKDQYTTHGDTDFSAYKSLEGADISQLPYKGMFKFTFDSPAGDYHDDQNFGDARTLVNGGNNGTDLVGDMSLKFTFTEPIVAGEPKVYKYTLKENALENTNITGISVDPAVFEIMLTISEPEVADGSLVIEKKIEKIAGDTRTEIVAPMTITFENEQKTGSLSVEKIITGTGALTDDTFTFNVQLTPEDPELNNAIFGRTFTMMVGESKKSITFDNEGKATLTLKGGEKALISGIPAPFTYAVTEADYTEDGYATTFEGESDTVVIEGTGEAKFTNKRDVGSLELKKLTAGNASDVVKDFVINVKLTYSDKIDLEKTKNLPKFAQGCRHSALTVNGNVVTFTVTLSKDEVQDISNILYGTAYEVSEADYSDYGFIEPVVNGNVTGSISDETSAPAVTYTNERNVTSLQLGKVTDGTGKDYLKNFDFTVTLTFDKDVDLTLNANKPVAGKNATEKGYVKNTTITPATDTVPGTIVYKITLLAGKTIDLTNILVGTKYAIVETDYTEQGYLKTEISNAGTAVTGLTAEGTLDKVESFVVTYTNTREAGSILVSKELAGNAAKADREFQFTVTLLKRSDAAVIIRDYPFEKTDAKGAKTTGTAKFVAGTEDGSAVYTFTLKGDETMKISDVLYDTQYKVEETDGNTVKEGYVVSDSPSTGTVDSTTSAPEVTVTNERNVASLQLGKVTDGTGKDYLKKFGFIVTLTFADDIDLTMEVNKPVASVASYVTDTVVSNADHTIEYSITLPAGKTIDLTNILVGTKYAIVETDYTEQGYLKTEISNAGTAVTGLTAEGTLDKVESFVVTYTNTREAGSILVSKELAGNAAKADREFQFTVTLLKRSDAAVIVRDYPFEKTDAKGAKSTGTAKFVAGTEDGSAVYAFTLKGDETMKISDVLYDTQYKVEETDGNTVKEGYVVSDSPSTGTVDSTTSAPEVTVTNERNTTSLLLKKVTAGAGKAYRTEFDFTVTLTFDKAIDLTNAVNVPALSVASYVKKTTVTPATDAANGTIEYKISLPAEKEIEISNILIGTAYEIEEADYTTDGFLTPEVNNAGTDVEGRTVNGTLEETESYNVTYKNTCNVGTLEIVKTISGNGASADHAFEFTVTLTKRADDAKIIRTYPAARTNASGTTSQEKVSFADDGNGNAVAKVYIKANEKLEISGIIDGTEYTIKETDTILVDEQYTDTVTEGSLEGVVDYEELKSVTVNNERLLGSLKLEKKTAGNASDILENFTVNVTLTYPEAIDLKNENNLPKFASGCKHSKLTINGNVVTFTVDLAKDEVQEITNILYNTAYVVDEKDYSEYGFLEPTVEGNVSGSIDETTPAPAVTYTNERNVTKLVLGKLTAGGGKDYRKNFEFTVTLTFEDIIDLTKSENLPKPDVKKYVDSTKVDSDNGTIVYKITLPADEALELSNILVGTAYEIVEADYTKDGYLVPTVDNAGTAEESRTVSGELSDKTAASYIVTYTNTRNTGSLEIAKTISGSGASAERPFEFTVTLLKRADEAKIDLSYPAIFTDTEGTEHSRTVTFKDDGNGNAVYTFDLKANEKLYISELLDETEYVVEETDATCVSEGYFIEYSPVTGEIDYEEPKSAVINNRRDLGHLAVTKKLAGNSPRAITEFNFTITLRRADGVSVAGTYPTGKDRKGTITFKETGTGVARATFKLKGDETLQINDILAGTNYVIVEDDYGYEGYSTVWIKDTGSIPVDAVVSATCTNTRNTGELSVEKIVQAVGMGIPVDQIYVFTINLLRPNGAGFTGTLRTEGGTGRITFVNGIGTLSLKHGEKVTIKDILEGSTYTVTEAVYPNTETTSTGSAGEIVRDEVASCVFTNTIRQIYRDLEIIKTFDDDNYSARVKSITVRVTRRDAVVGTYVLNAANNWRVRLTGLPRYDKNGNEYKYSVVELDVQPGYHAIYTIKNGVLVITNVRRDDPFIDDPLALGGGITMNEGYCFD